MNDKQRAMNRDTEEKRRHSNCQRHSVEEAGRQAGARGLVTCTTAVNGDNDDDDDASERDRKCIRANGLEQAWAKRV